ncbi:MAG: hypothetical protein AB1650_01735 [Candidatus Omnitrophota bacterium]
MNRNYGKADVKLGVQEKLIALKILLVIYLHDQRYCEAIEDIDELLRDPQMKGCREYLLLKQAQISEAMAGLNKGRDKCGLIL